MIKSFSLDIRSESYCISKDVHVYNVIARCYLGCEISATVCVKVCSLTEWDSSVWQCVCVLLLWSSFRGVKLTVPCV